MVWWKTTQQDKERMTSTIATTGTAATTEPAVTTHYQPVIRLTEQEREEIYLQHEYGICSSCDTGLDDPADFVSSVVGYDLIVRCTACYHYYAEEESLATMCGLTHYDEFSF